MSDSTSRARRYVGEDLVGDLLSELQDEFGRFVMRYHVRLAEAFHEMDIPHDGRDCVVCDD